MADSFEILTLDQRGPAAWLTLNRPQRLNAITPKMSMELAEYFEGVAEQTDTRVIVLRRLGISKAKGIRLAERLQAGSVCVNDMTMTYGV